MWGWKISYNQAKRKKSCGKIHLIFFQKHTHIHTYTNKCQASLLNVCICGLQLYTYSIAMFTRFSYCTRVGFSRKISRRAAAQSAGCQAAPATQQTSAMIDYSGLCKPCTLPPFHSWIPTKLIFSCANSITSLGITQKFYQAIRTQKGMNIFVLAET